MTDHHPTGLKLAGPDTSCKTCAWSKRLPTDWRCVAADAGGHPITIDPSWLGCQLWEAEIASCDPCGACCREAFDSVPVSDTDLERIVEPSKWVNTHEDGWRDLRRNPSPSGAGTRCRALSGDGAKSAPFRCHIYAQRPTNCRDLEIASEGCLMARRRVRLSSWHPEQTPEGPWASATASSNARAKKPG